VVVNMHVLIINLKNSIDRLVYQEKQLSRMGLHFERVNAVSTHDLSEEEYQQLGFGWQRPLRKVELACFLSHKKAWELVLKNQEVALILEDDAVLASHLPELLVQIEEQGFKDVDLVNFEVRSRKKIISKQPTYTFPVLKTELFELYQDRTGAAGYLLYPSGAQKLLARLEHSAPAIADGFIFSCYELRSLQVEPAAIIQEDQMKAYGLITTVDFDSTIGRSENYKTEYSSTKEKKKFKKRRIAGQWLMACRYLSVFFKATKRFILLDQKRFNRTQM